MHIILKGSTIIYNVLITFIIFIISLYLFHSTINHIRNVYRDNQLERAASEANYFKIFDLYGLPNHMPYSTFVKNKNSIRALNSLYSTLINIEDCNFLELNDTMVQLKGQYKNDYKFVHHYEDIHNSNELQQFINQELIKDGKKALYTNVKAILLGESAFNSYKLDEAIMVGRTFSNHDFYIDQSPVNLNVILGFQYKDIYNIGDEFAVLYLGEELNFKIIGFLRENTTIPFDKETIHLDYHIIMPSFNLDLNQFRENKLRKFATSHYSKKTWGYLTRTEDTDFIKISNDFKNEVKKLNLDYTLEPFNVPTNPNHHVLYALFQKRHIVISLFVQVIVFCMIMFLLFYYGNYRILKRYVPSTIDKTYLKQVKRNIYCTIFIQFFIGYLSAIALYKIISIPFVSQYMFLDALKMVVGMGLIVMLVTLKITSTMINQIFANRQ